MYHSQTCAPFDMHTTSKWWYSWELSSGFQQGDQFCADPSAAVTHARALGLDFVPMVKKTTLSPPYVFSAEITDNLNKAEYFLTLNEPERSGWLGTLPADAAAMWPDIEAVAAMYNIPTIVAPCTTAGNGMPWYNEWIGNCTQLYGPQGCHFDHSCIHFYYQPWDPELGDCSPGVAEWACVGPDGMRANNRVNQYYNAFNKPVWVTGKFLAAYVGMIVMTAAPTLPRQSVLVSALFSPPS